MLNYVYDVSHHFNSYLLHLFSFAFGQCSITIRRHIRQFVIEQNNAINFIRDWPLCKTHWTPVRQWSLVIVNWTLCITFGIFKLFGQWAVYFVTLVRVWKAPWRTVWNECRMFLKNSHFYAQCWRYSQWRTETQFRRLVTHICQSLCTNSGRCAEFCSCVQTVLTIDHLELQKCVFTLVPELRKTPE